jgi:hypothetical protein
MQSSTQPKTSTTQGTTSGTWWGFLNTVDVAAQVFTSEVLRHVLPEVEEYDDDPLDGLVLFSTIHSSPTAQEVKSSTPPTPPMPHTPPPSFELMTLGHAITDVEWEIIDPDEEWELIDPDEAKVD